MKDIRGEDIDPSIDEPTPGSPDGPDYREGINVWIWDDGGRIGFPRMGIESVGRTWDTERTVMANLVLPGGRVMAHWKGHAPLPVTNNAGQPRVIGAGPMRFECIEPFAKWRMAFDGTMAQTTLADQVAGSGPASVGAASELDPVIRLSFDIEMGSVLPPWFQGSLGGHGRPPGENRFEQLFRAAGTVRIDGKEWDFSGGGVRVHRKGGNRTPFGNFFGHTWHTAFFPSGNAFAINQRYPGIDGSAKYCEAWAIRDGQFEVAEVLDPPWLQSAQVWDDAFSFTLRTAQGDTRIEGCSFASVFSPERKGGVGMPFPDLQQAIGLYRWDGEEAYGMIERSQPVRALKRRSM